MQYVIQMTQDATLAKSTGRHNGKLIMTFAPLLDHPAEHSLRWPFSASVCFFVCVINKDIEHTFVCDHSTDFNS